jgi:2-polyprenyl-3-methyl-5-hydroxy-6-metoxy-1,4-benzoquinol methylase
MMSRPTYREYLKRNGIPLKYDLSTEEGMREIRSSTARAYKSLYDDFDLSKDDRILEIGCHYGAFVLYLNQRGIIPDAIDSDERKIEILKSDENLKANFIGGEAGEFLQGKKELYDYVVMNFVLEHIGRNYYIEFLKTVQKSLKRGGKLVVTVPNMENPFNLRIRYSEPTHVNGFTTESLIWSLYVSGFDEIVCRDAKKYDEEKFGSIQKYFEDVAELMEIRSFHGKFSESLLAHGTKIYDLQEIKVGPYDY